MYADDINVVGEKPKNWEGKLNFVYKKLPRRFSMLIFRKKPEGENHNIKMANVFFENVKKN